MGIEIQEKMTNHDFRDFCENYPFNNHELKEYCEMEIKLMELHLDKVRSNGDKRDKNTIYMEWIEKYSEFFRIMWVMLSKGDL